MEYHLPQGFRAAGVHCGIKSDPKKEDLSLIVSDRDAVTAGVYTQNVVCGAPVLLDRARTPSEHIRAVVVNSGVANACTGDRGLRDAESMAQLAADCCGADQQQALVLSTGVIGQHLPMERIAEGIADAASRLAETDDALLAAARGMMTTDTVHKIFGTQLTLDGQSIQVTGVAKGAAMIGPNMATMLAVVMTDAALTATDAQVTLTEAVDDSFNCISVEGHMSTSDSVLLLANGAAGGPVLAGESLRVFKGAVGQVCEELARAIPSDGEGASHLITIEVHGCTSVENARQIARNVADSPLVKTAMAGADPNWGRIVSAAGYAGVTFDPTGVSLLVNGFLLYESGAPVEFEPAKVSASIRGQRETGVVLLFSEGSSSARFWTSDLTAEYVRLNAEYHT